MIRNPFCILNCQPSVNRAVTSCRGSMEQEAQEPEEIASSGANLDEEVRTDDVVLSLADDSDERWKSLIPAELFDFYEFHNYHHAAEVLTAAYPALFAELCEALRVFRIKVAWILQSGGNESEIPRAIQHILYPGGWHETRLTGHLEFVKNVTRKSPLLDKNTGLQRFTASGRMRFTSATTGEIVRRENVIDAHKIDHVKGRVAFDMEWNSKDQTFDRDLYAMRIFHEAQLIGAGVLLTRSIDLNPIFRALDPYGPQQKDKRISAKYGASTTWMGKLLYRLQTGRSGGCPVLAVGIKRKCISDWEDFANARDIRL
jgi:CRISPR-associated protein Csd2